MMSLYLAVVRSLYLGGDGVNETTERTYRHLYSGTTLTRTLWTLNLDAFNVQIILRVYHSPTEACCRPPKHCVVPRTASLVPRPLL